jgi:hypothetical protein
MPPHLLRLCAAASLVLVSLPVGTLLAQSVPAPASSTSAAPATASTKSQTSPGGTAASRSPDDAVVLSPFEVSTSGDVGYLATNSLAGSRLNSSLKDTPAIIDVFTKEFLIDIGATNLEQAMVYANNSQIDDG